MRAVEVRERSVDLSRYSDPSIPSGGLTTSIVALVTDVERNGRPVVGYGFAFMGRFAQGGLIRERCVAVGTLDLRAPHSWYPYARAITRRIVYHAGEWKGGGERVRAVWLGGAACATHPPLPT